MNLKRVLMISLIVLALVCIASVSAGDNETSVNENISAACEEPVLMEEPSEEILSEEPANVTVEIPEKLYKDDAVIDCIRVELPEDASGDIVVKFNDSQFYCGKIDSYIIDNRAVNLVYLDPDKIDYGSYLVNVNVSGKYSFIKTSTMDVTYHLDVADKIIYGSATTPIDIHEFWQGKLNVTVDGESYGIIRKSDADFDSTYISLDPLLSVGMHQVVLSYWGDKSCPDKSVTRNITVYGRILVGENTYVNDEVTLTLPDDAKGRLVVYLDDNVYSNVSLVNGKASVKLNNLAIGHYSLLAKYEGDDYNVSDEQSSLSINPKFSYPTFMLIGDDKSVSVYMPGAKGILIFKNFEDEITITKKLADGRASISLSKQSVTCDADCSVTFKQQDDNGKTIAAYSESFTLTIDSPFSPDKDVSVLYTAPLKYSMKVTYNKKPLAGKLITFIIGGKKFYSKTDKNGNAGFKVSGLAPKKYHMTVCYQKRVWCEREVTVKHLLVLKSVKVKKSAKKLVLTASLKKVSGKYLKGKKITFKFNGKKYTAKTSKKGVAKVTIKKSVLKKLKKGKKVKYQVTYMKDTVKKSCLVK